MVNSSTIETRLFESNANENSDFHNEAAFSNCFALEVSGMMFGFKMTIVYCLMRC